MTDGEFRVVIPARMESSRLPGKPLADIGGVPMIIRVARRAQSSRAASVLVATDSEEIASVCREAAVDVQMTSADHASGTDRIAEVAAERAWTDETIVVNVQGDEPLIPPLLIDQVAALLGDDSDAGMATLQTPFDSIEQFHSVNTAKVISDGSGSALYFSRAPVPAWTGDGVPITARRHVGMYAYRCRVLRRIAGSPPCELETAERLEQLRALWLGIRVVVADALERPPHGVDTTDDLERIRILTAREEATDRGESGE